MREFDLVLYGATGFTGRQAVDYLLEAHPHLRFAIAGRSETKLAAIASARGRSIPWVVADSSQPTSLDALAARTRVLISTVGPFAQYGDPVVDACVRRQTHYADITGETPWVRGVVARHHTAAQAQGTLLVPFAGFDSIPPDLGVWLLVREVRARLGSDTAEVQSLCRVAGGFNGGTLASAVGLGQDASFGNPRLLDVPDVPLLSARRLRRVEWSNDFNAWLAPFFMTPVNAAVVRRSAGLAHLAGQPYGSQFTYREAWGSRSWFKAASLAAGTIGGAAALRTSLGRRVLAKFGPAPGEGPPEDVLKNGFFSYDFIARTPDGRSLRARFADRGDPGNRCTVKYLCETGILLSQRPHTPGAGGVLTPSACLGETLLERLRQVGTTIEVVD